MNKSHYFAAITAVVFIGVTGVVVISIFGKPEQVFPIVSAIFGFLTSIVAAMILAIHRQIKAHDAWEREVGGMASLKIDALNGHTKDLHQTLRSIEEHLKRHSNEKS